MGQRNVFERHFEEIRGEPDFEYALIDGTIAQAHQKASGAKGTQVQAIGRSRRGLTKKIVALVDALGNQFDFVPLPGQAHNLKGVAPLIEDVAFDAALADKAFAADGLLAELDARVRVQSADKHASKWQHMVENFFARVKEFRAIAARYEKTA